MRDSGKILLGLEDDHHVVQAGLEKLIQVGSFCQAQPVSEKPADLSICFGVGDQSRQIITQSWLTAGQDDVGDTYMPDFIEN